MTTLTVHTAPGCGKCSTLLMLMTKRGIPHETVDVSTNPDAHARLEALGYHQLPVTTRHNEHGTLLDHWPGYNPAKFTD